MTEHIANYAKKESTIAIGTAGLLGVGIPEGYFCTVCAVVEDDSVKHRFQDLHITREQAEQITRQLQSMLEQGD